MTDQALPTRRCSVAIVVKSLSKDNALSAGDRDCVKSLSWACTHWVTTTNFMGFHPFPRFRAYLGASRPMLGAEGGMDSTNHLICRPFPHVWTRDDGGRDT